MSLSSRIFRSGGRLAPLMAAVLLLMPSCADGDLAGDASRRIGFTADGAWAGEPAARSAGRTAFTDGDAVSVTAATASGSVVMNHTRVTLGGGTWTYSPVCYWPADEPLTFTAFFPYAETSADGTVACAVDGSTDIMYARADDVSRPADGTVALSFKHLLRQLRFRFVGDETAGYTAVRAVSVTNCHKAAVLDPSTGTLTYTDDADGTLTLSGTFPITEDGAVIDESLLTDAESSVVNLTLTMSDGSTKDLTATLPDGGTAGRTVVIAVTFASNDIGANCYIVDTADFAAVRRIPIARVNVFWSLADAGDASQVLAAGDEWETEVIWQTQDRRVIDFCDADGNLTADGTGDKFYGTGAKGYFYFRLHDVGDGSASVPAGNVLVGLKRRGTEGAEYLWSWHLWLTPYDPGTSSPTVADGFSATVPDGEIHKYYARYGNASTSWKFVEQAYDFYFMDRDIGALTADPSAGYENTCGLFFQAGRKDPFPAPGTTLYGIDGKGSQPTFTATDGDNIVVNPAQGTFAASVRHPYEFFCSATADWVSPNPYSARGWNEPSEVQENHYSQRLFDPCPAGWIVSESGGMKFLWYAWTMDSNSGRTSPVNADGDFSDGYRFYYSAKGSGPTAWYPAAGRRDGATGALTARGTEGWQWTSAQQGNSAFRGTFSDGKASYYGTQNRANGCNVRAIQKDF